MSRVDGNIGNRMFVDFQDLCRVGGAFANAAPPNCSMLLRRQHDDFADQFCLATVFFGPTRAETMQPTLTCIVQAMD